MRDSSSSSFLPLLLHAVPCQFTLVTNLGNHKTSNHAPLLLRDVGHPPLRYWRYWKNTPNARLPRKKKQTTVRQFAQEAPHVSFWRKLYESGEYKRWLLYAVEAYGIFKIGEMVGRRHVVGYKLDESRTHALT